MAVRQLCLSADMVPASYLEDLRNPPVDSNVPATSISSLTAEDCERLVEKLRQAVADQEECSVSIAPGYLTLQVCYDVMDDPRITDCGHPCK